MKQEFRIIRNVVIAGVVLVAVSMSAPKVTKTHSNNKRIEIPKGDDIIEEEDTIEQEEEPEVVESTPEPTQAPEPTPESTKNPYDFDDDGQVDYDYDGDGYPDSDETGISPLDKPYDESQAVDDTEPQG